MTFRPARTLRRLALASAVLLGVAVPQANAYVLHATITGAGHVTETTDAHLLNCISSDATPTGAIGATCDAGSAGGPMAGVGRCA
jgi:hypothetical protein